MRAHAVRRRDGDLAVLLLNEDPDAARTVRLSYPGFTPAAGRPVVLSYLNGAKEITTGRAGSATSQTLPPYSLTAVVLSPKQSTYSPPAPGTPTASDVTDTTATLSWPAARRGRLPVTGYDVYLTDTAGTRLAGYTREARFSLTDLDLGTRYTATVVARDGAGRASWSSAPVVFVTRTPAESTCAVKLTETGNWGTGYVGSLDVTNTGTEPVTDWTLAFEFPRPWLSFGSGWNATWTAEGTKVTAAGDAGAELAPGATVTVGYVGNYAGPNVKPAVFTLNDTVCSTR